MATSFGIIVGAAALGIFLIIAVAALLNRN